jgi:microcystin-dependent protein
MPEQFLGEIQFFAFNYPPKGWAFCAGQLLSIAQNQALFALLQNQFGGDGRTTFALPDLRGRVPMGQGGPWENGQLSGEESHVLTEAEIPQHNHTVGVVSAPAGAAKVGPAGNLLTVGAGRTSGGSVTLNLYAAPSAMTTMGSGVIGPSPGAQGHENRMPFVVLNPCIALTGVFPSSN